MVLVLVIGSMASSDSARNSLSPRPSAQMELIHMVSALSCISSSVSSALETQHSRMIYTSMRFFF